MHNPLILSDDEKQYTDFTNKILFGEMEIDLYKRTKNDKTTNCKANEFYFI